MVGGRLSVEVEWRSGSGSACRFLFVLCLCWRNARPCGDGANPQATGHIIPVKKAGKQNVSCHPASTCAGCARGRLLCRFVVVAAWRGRLRLCCCQMKLPSCPGMGEPSGPSRLFSFPMPIHSARRFVVAFLSCCVQVSRHESLPIFFHHRAGGGPPGQRTAARAVAGRHARQKPTGRGTRRQHPHRRAGISNA